MEKSKHKILVLSDLKESDSTMLKSTVSLAKMIDGEIHFLTVKKPTEIVKKESQLSAMRSINQEYFAVKKSMLDLIEPVSKAYNIEIKHILTYGNIKSEIGNYIKNYNPDVVVLGKRKPKILKLVGDNIAKYVFKQHKGTIMISANDNAFEPDNKLNLGLLNNYDEDFDFSKNIIECTQKPVQPMKIQ
jgi:nucleotide-binding universal stress UspA family protein